MDTRMDRRSFIAASAATAAVAASGIALAQAEEAPAQPVAAYDCDIVVAGLGASGFMEDPHRTAS